MVVVRLWGQYYWTADRAKAGKLNRELGCQKVRYGFLVVFLCKDMRNTVDHACTEGTGVLQRVWVQEEFGYWVGQ